MGAKQFLYRIQASRPGMLSGGVMDSELLPYRVALMGKGVEADG